MQGKQILIIKNLIAPVQIGILDYEKVKKQKVKVNAQLNLGFQELLPENIENVLDYRQVRQIIIDICSQEHTDILENLTGKVALNLSKLDKVLGVKVSITKLEIFEDCQAEIEIQLGDI